MLDIAIIFDMDGLLIDSEPLWAQAEIEVFSEFGVPLTEELCNQTKGLRQDEVVQYWYNRFPWEKESLIEVEERIIFRMEQLISTVGKPMSGAIEAIQLSQKMDFKLGLATSSPMRLVNATLKRLGQENSFTAIHSAENETFGKPHPAVYLTTAQSLGVHPTKCVVFEDSLQGLISAKAARMRCIVIPDPKEKKNPCFALADQMLYSAKDIDLNFLEKLLTE